MTDSQRRLPAEWEPHRATFLAWPFNRADWPGKFTPIPWVFAEILRHVLPGEPVFLAVSGEVHEGQARRMLQRAHVDISRVTFVRVPLDRGWMRDISPAFVKAPGSEKLTGVRFGFNAWAKYDNYGQDAQWAPVACKLVSARGETARWKRRPVILEGGALDGNGDGLLLTTEECLLDATVQTRNPGFIREDYEALFAAYLGVKKVIWLGRGIAGDDTHGHVDDCCRFVAQRTVVACREANSRDANYAALEENIERLEGVRLPRGGRIEVVPLPMPAPVVFEGRRLPASYANFYITNAAVLVPTFNDPQDRVALGILAELFPDRIVVGVHAVDLVWGLGTIHCLTHEVPA